MRQDKLTLHEVWRLVQEAKQAIAEAQSDKEKENFGWYLCGILTVAASAGFTLDQIERHSQIIATAR